MRIALALTASPAHALDGLPKRATLKGLTGVRVVVEVFEEKAKRAGFDERTFQTDVEPKLRMAGIEVLSKSDLSATPAMPYLYLAVNPLHERSREHFAREGVIDLYQHVRLEPDRSIRNTAATWSVGTIGIGDLAFIRESVKGNMDRFINAWLSGNPKQPERAP